MSFRAATSLIFSLLLALGAAALLADVPEQAPDKVSPGDQPSKPNDGEKDAKKPVKKHERRIVIGDVHGDFRAFEKLLRRLELVDRDGNWTGGKEQLIQTGDLVDRGPDSRKAIELLMKIEPQAEKAGGKVTVLIGNHEVMMLTGRTDFISAGEYAAFAKDESDELRAKRREALLELIDKGSPLLRSRYYQDLARAVNARTFDRVYPRGYFALRRGFSREGRYGKWILRKSFLYRDLETLFVHGGISPQYGLAPTKKIEDQLKLELKTYFEAIDELERRKVFDFDLGFLELARLVNAERIAGGPHADLRKTFITLDRLLNVGLLLGPEGPTWYRGLAQGDERTFARAVEQILEAQKVERIVMGHTVTMSKRIEGRFGNTVILIDTGMNQDHYGGQPSALLLQPDGSVRVFE